MNGLENPETIDLDTPFGKPSSPITIGTLEGIQVAFLARHGIGHHITPSEVPYRANMYALKALGVERVISINACGSLREDYAPGDIVIPDDIYDNTKNRVRSFFGEGLVAPLGAQIILVGVFAVNDFPEDVVDGVDANEKGGGTNFHQRFRVRCYAVM